MNEHKAFVLAEQAALSEHDLTPSSEPISAADLMAGEDDEDQGKRPCGLPGVDWVFDGGLPYFGTALVCSPGGSGKSTFLWELLKKVSTKERGTLYLSSEQSLKSLRRQLKRCGPPPVHMTVHAEQDYDKIIRTIEKEQPKILVLDSLHHVINITDEAGFNLAAGSPTAVTHVAKSIISLTSELEFLAFLVGHMNNDGTMAGGAHLRHAVDGTLVIRRLNPLIQKDPRRILEFENKSRFGEIGRRALFEMTKDGMKDRGPMGDEPIEAIEAIEQDLNVSRRSKRNGSDYGKN